MQYRLSDALAVLTFRNFHERRKKYHLFFCCTFFALLLLCAAVFYDWIVFYLLSIVKRCAGASACQLDAQTRRAHRTKARLENSFSSCADVLNTTIPWVCVWPVRPPGLNFIRSVCCDRSEIRKERKVYCRRLMSCCFYSGWAYRCDMVPWTTAGR